jgi:cullin-4
MFKDIELSTDVMKAYSASHTTSSPTFDLSVSILSMGNWPSYPAENVRIPDAMARSLERFKGFYIGKHSGRTLKWQHSLDYCSLKAVFPRGGKKELVVSLFQALVLLLFNDVADKGKLSFKEIAEATNMDVKELERTLQSLACGKVRVLVKDPKGREVADTDQFAFNTAFKDDHVKIKINQIQQKETVSLTSVRV